MLENTLAKKRHDAHLMELAKLGAKARLNELLQEAKILLVQFPHLRDSIDQDELPVSFLLRRGSERADARQARIAGGWTAAKRRAAAKRMKAYWAKQKAARQK
jgi:hypothetical protein